MKTKIFAFFLVIASFVGCKSKSELSVSQAPYGKTDGKDISLYTLTNANGMIVKIMNYGGIVTEIIVPDKDGKFENVSLGFDSLSQYIQSSPYFGGLIGRYGNRIKVGKFSLNGTEYSLATNNNNINHLHGGVKGYDKVVWDAVKIKGTDSVGLELNYISKDMEEGYPGTLTMQVKYILNNKNELTMYYEAETDKATVVNLTQHTYYNLSGCKEDILNHELTIYADSITPIDSTLIPTGKIEAVSGTPFDFTAPHKIGERIANVKGGYDHNFVLTRKSKELEKIAEVYEPKSGRLLEIITTEPGLQFYSGNFLDGTLTGIGKIVYQKYYGFCLETQHFPDSPNKPNFPSTVLNPGEKYSHIAIYRFSTRK